MGRLIGIAAAGAFGLIAAAVLYFAVWSLLYAAGVIGDVNYDGDPRFFAVFGAILAFIGGVFACLSVALAVSTLRR
jgi:hypothetical protein